MELVLKRFTVVKNEQALLRLPDSLTLKNNCSLKQTVFTARCLKALNSSLIKYILTV